MLASAPRLLRLTSPDRLLDRELLHARGGFAWWYLDAVDDAGDGVTVIWSFGLPFLPGYESAARRGEGDAPRERPSLNVVVYRGGQEAFYLLQEYPETEASWSADGERWRFGDSALRSWTEGDRRRVELDLDCPLPGTRDRLRGRIALDGVARRTVSYAPATLDDHDWSPLTGPARATARLRVGARPLIDFAGPGYHDRNGSRTPLSRVGIRHWIWGRVPTADRELVYYLLWPEDDGEPEAVGLEIDCDGHTLERPLEIALTERRRARYGMPFWRRVELLHEGRRWLTIDHDAPIDDGPFYLRFMTEAVDQHGIARRGTGELVRPARVDLAPLRPFVGMRVHHTAARGSRFNPLFLGPRRGRVRRQLGSLLGMTIGG